MKFNFECWALCLIEVETDPDDPEWRNIETSLLGLYLSREDAKRARDGFELANLKRHRQENHRAVAMFGWQAESNYSPGLYAFVPLSQVEGKDLSDFEEMILKAAKLSFLGVGVKQ